ncbi:hypothetical protein [Acuticoccus sp. I52.16.1]|uniref:hypothetical protein n=1 Tax=Acuticoccus sp. I52.16.1 TaxID=2928472 RepID=UPI001FD392FA|nr:hypothetical protein [Acuticoccus sp. I52.16.1]UOM34634.1 hypothetical protein MRB58_22950 [Acuticoccus sp. I52.16.1]
MSTKDNIEKEAHSASEKLHEAGESVKAGAREAAAEAQRTANSYADYGKTVAAGGLSDFASAVRRASDELSERDQDIAARFVSHAATSLEDIANSVSHTSVDDVVDTMKGFARRNPAVFVGGAVLAGLAVGRFLRSSGQRTPEMVAAPAPTSGYRPPASYTPTSPVAPSNSTPK